jgi:CRP-like cAMP-binding protein
VVCHKGDGTDLTRLAEGNFFGESAVQEEHERQVLRPGPSCGRLRASPITHPQRVLPAPSLARLSPGTCCPSTHCLQIRQANVVAVGTVRIAAIRRRDFLRLLGSLTQVQIAAFALCTKVLGSAAPIP